MLNSSRQCNTLCRVLLIAVFLSLTMMAGFAQAASGTFPDAAWNGLQISYSISGATVTGNVDKHGEARSNGFSSYRVLSGTLGSGTLQVSGSIRGGGVSSVAVVTVTAGGQTRDFHATIAGGQTQSFSVSVPIAADAPSGSIMISVLGTYNNAGGTTRDVVVRGSFTGSAPPKQDPPKQDPPKQDPPQGPLLFPPNAPPPPPAPPAGGGMVAPPAQPPQAPGKPATPPPDTEKPQTKSPENQKTDWGKMAVMAGLALVASALAAVLVSLGIWGFVMLTAPDIGLAPVLSPLLIRLAVALWTMPYVGVVVQGIFKGLETFSRTGIPTLKLLWQHWGSFKDYLAHQDFWRRHHQQLGNAQFPPNWDYQQGPTGGRRER